MERTNGQAHQTNKTMRQLDPVKRKTVEFRRIEPAYVSISFFFEWFCSRGLELCSRSRENAKRSHFSSRSERASFFLFLFFLVWFCSCELSFFFYDKPQFARAEESREEEEETRTYARWTQQNNTRFASTGSEEGKINAQEQKNIQRKKDAYACLNAIECYSRSRERETVELRHPQHAVFFFEWFYARANWSFLGHEPQPAQAESLQEKDILTHAERDEIRSFREYGIGSKTHFARAKSVEEVSTYVNMVHVTKFDRFAFTGSFFFVFFFPSLSAGVIIYFPLKIICSCKRC